MEQPTNGDLVEKWLQVRRQKRVDLVAEVQEMIAEGEKKIEAFDLLMESLDSEPEWLQNEGDAELAKHLQVARQELVEVIDQARASINNLLREIEGIDLLMESSDIRAKWLQLRARAAREVRREARENRGESDFPQERLTQRPRRRRTPRKGTLQDRVQVAAYEILKSGGWIKRSLLTKMIIESGVTINAQKPSKQVGKILKLDSRFQNDGRGYWSLVHEAPQSEEV